MGNKEKKLKEFLDQGTIISGDVRAFFQKKDDGSVVCDNAKGKASAYFRFPFHGTTCDVTVDPGTRFLIRHDMLSGSIRATVVNTKRKA